MKEKEKLIEAAHALGFMETEDRPVIPGYPEDYTCQLWAKEQIGGGSKLFVDKPSKIQCAAMRAVLYLWKVLRLVEVSVAEDSKLDSHVVLRFYKTTVEIDLPDEMAGGVLTPVRVISNLILGQILDDAIKTRGLMDEQVEEITQVKKIQLPDDSD
ncbi:MAG: hypothetical protein JRG91_09800 [Deltaproteobacteria bacterium]|nr:hypothetical protein [Deltaproteobacteria bacterium]